MNDSKIPATVAEAASTFGKTKPTVHSWCRRGLLDRAKLPGSKRGMGITRASIARLLGQIAKSPAIVEGNGHE